MFNKFCSFMGLVALGSVLFLFGGNDTASAKASTNVVTTTALAETNGASTSNDVTTADTQSDTDSSDVDTNDDTSDDDVALTPEEQAEADKLAKDEELNQQANNTNTRMQPWYTGSAIALNFTQIIYYLTASVSNVVGQGTSIVQTGTNILGTALSVLKP